MCVGSGPITGLRFALGIRAVDGLRVSEGRARHVVAAYPEKFFMPLESTSFRDGVRDPVGEFAEVLGQLGRSAHFKLAAQVQDL